MGLVLMLNVAYYTILSYLPSYLSAVLNMSESRALLLLVASMASMMLVINLVGRLSDRIGRKPIMLAAFLGFIFLSWPCFWMLMLHQLADRQSTRLNSSH